MREYIFVDADRVRMYFDQIRDAVALEDVEEARKTAIDLKGPSFEREVTRRPRAATFHEQAEAIYAHLLATSQVAHSRPTSMPNPLMPPGPPFVMETAFARKLIIPNRNLTHVPGLRHFALWIADPDPSDLSLEEWAFTGTFLLLVETFWDNGQFQNVYSGCSALQAIANVFEGKELVPEERPATEVLGQDSPEHPVEKLIGRLGGVALPPRRITSLYRKRYMTNEQAYTFSGHAYRVNDLLAYPLFIAAAS